MSKRVLVLIFMSFLSLAGGQEELILFSSTNTLKDNETEIILFVVPAVLLMVGCCAALAKCCRYIRRQHVHVIEGHNYGALRN